MSARNRIVVVTGSSLARVGANNTVRAGFEYRNNQLYSGDLYSRRVGYQVVAVNGMADLHPSDRVTLSLAGRVDRLWLDQAGTPRAPIIDPTSAYDRALTRVSFNAALLVRVGADGQLRINGGQGIQSPSSGVTRFANVGSFETYGASVAGSGRMTRRVGWLANYTWTRVHEALPSGGPPFAVTLAPATTTPEHVANIGLDYGGDRWFAAATARYTSSTRQFVFDRKAALLLLRVPRAIGVDARIGYHVTRHLDAYAAGENLSAAAGVAGSPIPADRRLRVGLNYTL